MSTFLFQAGGGIRVVAVTGVQTCALPIALAARFAAKEACFKALGTGWSQGVSFLQVEVQRGDGGAPRLALSGQAAERARVRGVTHLHVSLTHSAGVAAAAVILEG